MSSLGSHGPMLSSEVEHLLDLVEEHLESGDLESAAQVARLALDKAPHHVLPHYIWGEVCRAAGDDVQAEASFRSALALDPKHPAVRSALGVVCFDTLRLEEARRHLSEALRADPWFPEASFYRAMLRERRADWAGAGRDYHRAHHSDPERWPIPVPLDDATVEGIVESVILTLHPSIQSYLSNVAIVLEEVPATEVCLQFHPPMPPGEILGLFTGTPLTERSLDNPWSHLPPQILLFRCNLQRLADNREALLEELRITVFHEVGHFLGLSEQDLEDRDLD